MKNRRVKLGDLYANNVKAARNRDVDLFIEIGVEHFYKWHVYKHPEDINKDATFL